MPLRHSSMDWWWVLTDTVCLTSVANSHFELGQTWGQRSMERLSWQHNTGYYYRKPRAVKLWHDRAKLWKFATILHSILTVVAFSSHVYTRWLTLKNPHSPFGLLVRTFACSRPSQLVYYIFKENWKSLSLLHWLCNLGSWYSSWRPNTQLPTHHVQQTVIQLYISHCHWLQPASIALKTLSSVPILDCVSPGFGGLAFSNSCQKYNFFLPAGLPKSGKITSCQNHLTGSHGWRCRSSNKRTFWLKEREVVCHYS